MLSLSQSNQIRFIGKVTGIEENRKAVTEAAVGQEVAVKIEGGGVLYGRHFDYNDELFSQVSSPAVDALLPDRSDPLSLLAHKRIYRCVEGVLPRPTQG